MTRLEERIKARWSGEEKMLWLAGRWIDAPTFLKVVDSLTDALAKAGFGEGDRLATLLPVSPAYLALSVAVWSLGGTIIPLNGGATPGAMVPALKASGASVIVGMSPEQAQGYQSFGITLTLVDMMGLPQTPVHYTPSFKTPKELAVLFFTSGTTGNPKGVPLTHNNINTVIDTSYRHALPHDDTPEVMFNVLPNFHSLGCVVSGYLPLVLGFAQALQPNFLPVSDTLKALSESKATIAVVVPTMLHFLTGVAIKTGWKSETLKLIICGGDKLGSALEERLRQGLPVRLVEGYGLTEASPVLAVTSYDRDHRPGTVGQLLDCVEWKLTTQEGEPATGEGVLWVKGPSIITSYFGGIGDDRFDEGWLNTGDLVRVDDDGTVTILERVSDLIIVGGFNVYPQEVEQVLLAHPAVSGAGVVGCRQSVSGEVIRGYVTLKEGATVADGELVDWCRDRLPHFKLPRRVEVLDELPLNALGKVMRRKLRELCND